MAYYYSKKGWLPLPQGTNVTPMPAQPTWLGDNGLNEESIAEQYGQAIRDYRDHKFSSHREFLSAKDRRNVEGTRPPPRQRAESLPWSVGYDNTKAEEAADKRRRERKAVEWVLKQRNGG